MAPATPVAWAELIGTLTGILCVWLMIRQSIWTWPIGIVSVLLLMVVVYDARLYADAGLQAVYTVLGVYGWHHWLHPQPGRSELPVTRIGAAHALALALGCAVFTAGLGRYLDSRTDADLPYWNSLTTAMSLVAQFLQTRKVLESWLIWVAVDFVLIAIYVSKALYLMTGLYAVYGVLATLGFLEWRRGLAGQAAARA